MADTNTVDYTTDMQTIRDYVAAVTELQTKLAIAYTNALADVETTFQSASPAETRPDILGVMLKSGLKAVEKASVGAVKDATGVDVGPVVDMLHAIYDEVDRASKASTNLAAADWIKSLRLDVTNSYTQGQTGDALRLQLESEYNQGDEGARGGYIGGVENSLDAVRQTTIPVTQRIEVTMYESWINAAFNNDCVNGTGILSLQVNDDGSAGTAAVTAPYGDKVAGALNAIMAAAGVSNLMGLDVVKKLSQGDSSMCFEGNNVIRMDTDNDAVHAVLVSTDTWNLFQLFTT